MYSILTQVAAYWGRCEKLAKDNTRYGALQVECDIIYAEATQQKTYETTKKTQQTSSLYNVFALFQVPALSLMQPKYDFFDKDAERLYVLITFSTCS